MNIYEIDPTTDVRWGKLLQMHPRAAIFHTREWLEALRRTYGYTPIAFTTSPPSSPLTNGIPFCEIPGLLGGKRLVALPFSDHCVPLVENVEQLRQLLKYLRGKLQKDAWSCIQIRSNDAVIADPVACEHSEDLQLHKLDLRPTLNDIFQGFHPSCIQRKIKRATREGIVCRRGTSDALLDSFYKLLVVTRRKHGLPPQPVEWFRNVIACLKDKVEIHVAYNGDLPIASILTLRDKKTLVYKYGCSDHRFSGIGGIQLLMWEAIQEAKESDLSELDMGRSEWSHQGLIRFKDRWGASSSVLQYLKYPARHANRQFEVLPGKLSRFICSRLPENMLVAAGRLLYRYAG